MEERATGLILRTRPLTESSLIVHWLTVEMGRVATVAKGALRAKSNFRGKLDLFYLADFSFQRSRRSELHNLREVVLRGTHSALREDIVYLQQASYCAKLIEQATETATPLPGLYELMQGMLDILPAQPPRPLTVFAFEMKLLANLGLQPELEETRVSAGSRQILEKCRAGDWPTLARVRLSAAQAREIQQFLHGYLVYHLERIPAGREAALPGE